MERTSFEDWNCSVARTLECIGDAWTMMIVREAFYGTRTFSGFEQRLGISKNTLSRRLSKMERDGLLTCTVSGSDRRSLEYRLTDKGRDLFPVLVAMTQWGDRWQAGDDGPPVILKSRRTGREIGRLEVTEAGARRLRPKDVRATPGPGADEETRERFGQGG